MWENKIFVFLIWIIFLKLVFIICLIHFLEEDIFFFSLWLTYILLCMLQCIFFIHSSMVSACTDSIRNLLWRVPQIKWMCITIVCWDSLLQVYTWCCNILIYLFILFFFFPFFIRYLAHLHFQCYTKSPPYPPTHTPLPAHSPFLTLAFPCSGAYKVCVSNGPKIVIIKKCILVHIVLSS
jgi:hypothetical protein